LKWSNNPSKRGRYAEWCVEKILRDKGFQIIARYKGRSLSNEPSDVVFFDLILGCIYLAEVKTRKHFGPRPGTVNVSQIRKLLDSCLKMAPLVVLPLVIMRGRHTNWYFYPYDNWKRWKKDYTFLQRDGIPLTQLFPGDKVYSRYESWNLFLKELPSGNLYPRWPDYS